MGNLLSHYFQVFPFCWFLIPQRKVFLRTKSFRKESAAWRIGVWLQLSGNQWKSRHFICMVLKHSPMLGEPKTRSYPLKTIKVWTLCQGGERPVDINMEGGKGCRGFPTSLQLPTSYSRDICSYRCLSFLRIQQPKSRSFSVFSITILEFGKLRSAELVNYSCMCSSACKILLLLSLLFFLCAVYRGLRKKYNCV